MIILKILKNKIDVKIKFLNEEARKFKTPVYRYKGDAGVDLHCVLDSDKTESGLTIYPYERVLISAGIAIRMPDGYWGRITHRSSTESKLRIRIVEGTLDTGYTGPIFIQVSNINSYPIKVNHGDRLAQLIFHEVIQGNFTEVDDLGDTDRGISGFGSTGTK